MVKKTKGKHRLDKYYHLAKEQGFRSRAAFKLIQLNRKYGFLQNCKALLDLCAAPGGWMQVAAKNMPLSSLIIGVDLAPIKPIRGCRSYISDITTSQCRQLLKKEAAGSLFDVVLHDGAPNVGGAWSSEAYTQSVLVADALALAVEFLAPGGTFVTKVFRSKDYNALLYAFGQLFNKVEATKPQASRNASAEIFVVCLGYKAPAKVDPRLLDPKHLFQEVAEAPKVMGPEALLKQKIKQKRHRDGYEDGLSSSHKAASAVSFLLNSNAVEMLGQVTQLLLEGPGSEQTDADGAEGVDAQQLAAAIRSHPSTDGEIKELCRDLQVLGRSEFKQLLRWRLGLRKALKPLLGSSPEDEAKTGSHKKQQQQQGGGGADAAADGEEQQEEDAEQRLLAEMEAIKDAAEKRVRKEKRRRRELKKKAKVRNAQLSAAEGGEDNSGAPDDEQLFGLGVLDAAAAAAAAGKGGSSKAAAAAAAAAAVLKKVSSAAAPGERELELLEEPEEDEVQWSDTDSDASSLDSDEAALDYEAELEEQLDAAYASYLERKGVRDAAAKEKRQRLGKGGELGENEEDGGVPTAAAAAESDSEDDPEEYGARLQQAAEEASEDEAAAAAGAGGGLLVQLDAARAGVAKGGAAAAAQWFGQDLFDDANVNVSSEEEEEEQEQQQAKQHKLKRQPPQGGTAADGPAADQQQQQQQRASKRQKTAAGAAVAGNGVGNGLDAGGGSVSGSEADSDGSDADSDAELDSDEAEFNALDDAGKAEVLALAKKMLRRKDKDSIVEAAYNRYAFHDDKLPRWFAEDERRHMRPLPQVTKEDIEAEKVRLAAIDARPIKKVAEAKARKQKRLQARLDAARAKATSIAAQEDMPMSSKMKEIEKVYAKARAGGGAKGKGGKGGKGAGRKGKGPPLDGRMKKDKRGMDRAAARMKGGKGRKMKGGGVRKKGGRR